MFSELPKRPLPHAPKPSQPAHPHVQQPTVYVYEKQVWEYKVVTASVVDEPLPTEDDLNAFGTEGWELVGVVALPTKVQYYFKRARR
jgi:hypothetical protein